MARNARLSVMLTEELKQKLKRLADGMGMTESALSAYIIGQWVYTQQGVNEKVLSALGASEMAQLVKSVLSEGQGAERM